MKVICFMKMKNLMYGRDFKENAFDTGTIKGTNNILITLKVKNMNNKVITETAKEQIKLLTEDAIKITGGQNQYANKVGISSAHISNLLNKNWDNIGEKMWKKMADACGYSTNDWQVVETKVYKAIHTLLVDAKENANVYAVIAEAGAGKTVTTKLFARENKNVFRVECAEYWNKKAFMVELLQAMGRPTEGMTIYELMKDIEDTILKMHEPLFILDEADKLRDEVFYFFITIYNKLYGKCGLFLCSTNFFEKRIKRGLQLNKKGYQEIFSRFGRRFVFMPKIGTYDITAVARANGIEDTKMIETIVKDADADLRRVERLVHKHHKLSAKKEVQNEQ